MQYKQFGNTGIKMPVITCGCMQFQHSWRSKDPVPDEAQERLEACMYRAMDLGINHFETARAYGTSEGQMGKVLAKLPRDEIILQTKVGPMPDLERFQSVFDKSMGNLQQDRVDLFGFHGINNDESLDNALKCMEKVETWKREGRIEHVGFSTHAPNEVILKAINTGAFDYLNLHWFYIHQDNWPAIEEASRRGMGVMIISPNDKGGHLYNPSDKLCELTAPLHPMVFNGLFILSRPEVHTISHGVVHPEHFDGLIDAAEKLDQAEEVLAPILERLTAEMEKTFGKEWTETWDQGLPQWTETPGNVQIPWILRLRNLAKAFGMTAFAKARYNRLGGKDSFFPGQMADKIDELDLSECLKDSPHAADIPEALKDAHELLLGEAVDRLVVEEE